jgi:ABC-type lipoprotein export system ATPase subunit
MLSFTDVGFSYGEQKIFEHLSLSLPETGLVIITGKSGSGKTTFLSLCSGLLLPTSGKITYNYQEKPSLLFQSALLLDYLNVKENVLLPLWLNHDSKDDLNRLANDALKRVHLESYALRDIKTLSGGEAIRVSLARALVQKRSTLILDEPTGQLDEKNSLEIYQLLKDLSVDHLVLLVTHDNQNAFGFADCLFELQNRKLVQKTGCLVPETRIQNISSKKEKKSPLLSFQDSFNINLKFIKKRKARVLLCTIFLAFSLSLLYLGLNLNNHLNQSMNDLLESYYSYHEANIYTKEKIATDGHLTLEKYSLPDRKILDELGIKAVYPSQEYFISPYQDIRILKEEIKTTFQPVIQEDSTKLLAGSGFLSSYDCVINQTFLEELHTDFKEVEGKTINLSHQVLIRDDSLKTSDLVPLNFTFKITGLAKEKTAFNSATVYYSYNGVNETLEETYLKNISQELDEEVSILNLLTKEEYFDSDFGSRKYLFVSNSPSNIKEKANQLYSDKVLVQSRALDVFSSTKEIISSLSKIALVFLGLTLLSAFMLEFLAVYSLFEENIRLFALAKTMSDKQNRKRIALGLSGIFFFLAITVLVGESLLFTWIVNLLLAKNDYPAFLSIFDFKAFGLVSVLILLVTFLASKLPLRRIKDEEINKEMQGEE